MSGEHYFSQQPASEQRLTSVSFEVNGQTFDVTASTGTFSSTRLDAGTKVLLDQFENFPQSGDVLDIGCGWGPISLAIAKASPDTRVWALDVNQRSLDLVRKNAAKYDLKNITACTQDELPETVRFQAIWSNPPIRVGKKVLHELMLRFIPRLERGGEAMLVVQKQLGAESFQKWLQENFSDHQVSRHAIDKGYRVIRVTAPATPQ
jgi:16S rRNA (guanine1207-N2)-methyltransferase